MKTVDDITQDVYDLIKGSELHEEIKGKLCKTQRPLDSRDEDITIAVSANQNGQIQEAYVNVNIYVPDLFAEQRYIVDSLRASKLERLAADLFDVYNSHDSYRITLESQTLLYFENNKEHIINNRLLYRQSNE